MKTFEQFITEIADTSAVAHAKNRSHLFKTSRDDPARVKARVHVKTTVDEPITKASLQRKRAVARRG